MPYTDILYGVDDFVATITLSDRPDKLNAWTSEMRTLQTSLITRSSAQPQMTPCAQS